MASRADGPSSSEASYRSLLFYYDLDDLGHSGRAAKSKVYLRQDRTCISRSGKSAEL